MAAAYGIALAILVVHLVFNNRYGYFRDELDYLACARHLAWGFVDHPPLTPLMAAVSDWLLPNSLRALRFLPALAMSATVVITGLLTRDFGGRGFAVTLAATTVAIAPMFLSDGSMLTTNSLEPLLWTACVCFAVLAIKRSKPHYWLGFGLVAGIGLEEKYSIAILGFGIVAGLVLTRERRALANRWFWVGGALALLLFLPNLLWNAQNHFPFLELTRNIKASGRDVALTPFQFLAQQMLLVHPLTAPIWIAGLVGLLLAPRFRTFRFLGWCYLVALTAFVVLKGKNYYLAPIYPMLLAAGAVLVESTVERWSIRAVKPAILIVLLAGGIWLAPITVPILTIPQFIAYMDRLPFDIPRTEVSHAAAALPQHYADQFGWQEMAAATAQAWNHIPEAERPGCGIFAQNYGQAGAIDFFGPRYGLPPPLSGHQTYYLWGPRGYSGNCLVVLADRRERLQQLFERVEYAGMSDHPYALERHVPIFVCHGSKFGSLAQLWPELKKWR
jgi:4-amino-4-deoxy-L-arabinose transferase-like glycosyltransferase